MNITQEKEEENSISSLADKAEELYTKYHSSTDRAERKKLKESYADVALLYNLKAGFIALIQELQ